MIESSKRKEDYYEKREALFEEYCEKNNIGDNDEVDEKQAEKYIDAHLTKAEKKVKREIEKERMFVLSQRSKGVWL